MNFVIIMLTSFLLTACASTKPYAIIDGSMSDEVDPKNYDVIISGADGKLFFGGDRKRRFEPGFHFLKLTTTKADQRGALTHANFPIVMKPCMRY